MALVHPDRASPVVVDDDRHVRVPALVAGLVHADGTQMVEQARTLFGAQLVGDPPADRGPTLFQSTRISADTALLGACSSSSLVQPMSRCRQRRAGRRSCGRPCPPHPAHRPMSFAYGRTGPMTRSPPIRSFSMRGVPVTTFAGRPSMRLSAPADMAGTGVPPVPRFYSWRKQTQQENAPLHTRTRENPGHDTKAQSPTTQTGEDSFVS